MHFKKNFSLLNKNKIVKTKEPIKASMPVIFAIFKSKPYPASQNKCLNSFKI